MNLRVILIQNNSHAALRINNSTGRRIVVAPDLLAGPINQILAILIVDLEATGNRRSYNVGLVVLVVGVAEKRNGAAGIITGLRVFQVLVQLITGRIAGKIHGWKNAAVDLAQRDCTGSTVIRAHGILPNAKMKHRMSASDKEKGQQTYGSSK